ncbi:MAG: hypothetical protein ABJB93_11025 [Gaiellales bacterium]
MGARRCRRSHKRGHGRTQERSQFGGNVRPPQVEAPRGPGVGWIGFVLRAAGTGLHVVTSGAFAVGRGAFVSVTLRTRTPARAGRQISAMFARIPAEADVSVAGHQTIVTGPCGSPIAIFQRAPHGGAGWVDSSWICPETRGDQLSRHRPVPAPPLDGVWLVRQRGSDPVWCESPARHMRPRS